MSTFAVEVVRESKKGDNKVATLHVDPGMPVLDLRKKLETEFKIDRFRQGIKFEHPTKKDSKGQPAVVRLTAVNKTLRDYDVTKGVQLVLKDNGPQFSYRGVFFWEYFGPMAIVALLALRPSFIYGEGASEKPMHFSAILGVALWVLHYLKREVETFFVHKFSRPTMPLSNLFKNCTYYWGFAAAIGYVLCHPDYTPTSDTVAFTACAVMVLSEILNGMVHLQLSNMRTKEGSDERPAPEGGFFNIVSCPNYMFEVMAWISFAIMTNIFVVWVFVLVGLAQMTQWALGKHRGYKKQNPNLKRKAIIPFVL